MPKWLGKGLLGRLFAKITTRVRVRFSRPKWLRRRIRARPGAAYVSIYGERQGAISRGCGGPVSAGREYSREHADEIRIRAFSHGIHVPILPNGLPAQPRRHHPLVILKAFDRSSPLLYTALITGERIPECTIRWYRTRRRRKEEHYFTHVLKDAAVIRIEAFTADTQQQNRSPKKSGGGPGHWERISFVYRAIIWRHEIIGIEGADQLRRR